MSFPLFDRLKRFLAAECVFCFGILILLVWLVVLRRDQHHLERSSTR